MIDRVDEFIFLDDVDVIQRDWKTRNRIRKERTAAETKWLSVPIAKDCHRGTPIAEARIGGDGTWRRRHVDAVTAVYSGAPHFGDALDLLRRGLDREALTLADLNVGMVGDTCEYLGIETPLRRASQTPTQGAKTLKLLALCQTRQAEAYLANNGSSGYLEAERFEEAGISVRFQDYEHPHYEQVCDALRLPYLSHLSVLDLIANHGHESLSLLRQGRPDCATGVIEGP
jgi:hypothetical protein